MANKDTAKQWFQTGDKPTQAQFEQLFDWLRWGDQAIAMADITGLVTALLTKLNVADWEGTLIAYNGPATYTIPAGYLLEKIIVYYGDAGAIQISTVNMGDTDEYEQEEVAAGWNRPMQLDIFAEANTDVYIDGIPAGSKIVYLTRKIKTA